MGLVLQLQVTHHVTMCTTPHTGKSSEVPFHNPGKMQTLNQS
jgi:hypothetical protein